jgi:hypothetical protein
MAGSKSPNVDHTIHQGNDIEQLRNCYKSLSERSEDLEQLGVPWTQRAEFAAYDIILAMRLGARIIGRSDGQYEAEYPNHPRVQAALTILKAAKAVKQTGSATLSTRKQNWNNFWQAVNEDSVSYLMACAAELSFNQIRFAIMRDLKNAYKPRADGKPGPVNDWTPENLKHALGFDNHQEVKDFCETYGVGFTMGQNGNEVLDIQSMSRGKLLEPADLRPQFHSKDIVEAKRQGRSFSEIIQGTQHFEI